MTGGAGVQFFLSMEPQCGATYAQQLRVAQAAEELGFGGVFRSDHFLDHRPGSTAGTVTTDVWVTLAGLARETRRIRLGSLLTCAAYRPPAVLAAMVAQVDDMSAGRVELGLGAGWFAAEHEALGIPLRAARERFAVLEEQLQIVRRLWQERPDRRPMPPLVVGGRGTRRTPLIAARYADEHNIARPSVQDARTAVEAARRACRTMGRDPASLRHSVLLRLHCTGGSGAGERGAGERGAAGTVAGDPSQVVERLAAYAALGVTRVYHQVVDFGDLRHLELLAREVLPAVLAMKGGECR
ncbi:LLM class flavin-dependent oxidoreductase [Streptomyces sp. NPDC000618]|uniref:LLM class flavin-dependent oxidoreductase n=1 Tax=Streptomyces sp. NPDC000618 TaxID=3154265 RepID=UPI00331F992B